MLLRAEEVNVFVLAESHFTASMFLHKSVF